MSMNESEPPTLDEETLRMHLGGKIEIRSKVTLRTREDLARAYTPGFAHVARWIHRHPEDVYRLTLKQNTVAIVTDGTAVSGIGDVGPHAALPVMEGKALLFKQFAGIDAFPICLATKNVDEIVRIVTCLEPSFGGVMLEDISAPRCFDIEDRLQQELAMPVLHDDQHATAVAAAAALINALRVVNKRPQDLKVVMVGAGAAGTASAKLFMEIGVENLIACDRQGAIHRGRSDLNAAKQWFADHTNPEQARGSLGSVMAGADVFLGLSGPGVVTIDDVKRMGRDAIVFALANPIPEVLPHEVEGLAAVVATGRSDYPNQIDCGLCYPGMFRGALDCRARGINEAMKLAAAYAIADAVDPNAVSRARIMPSIFDDQVAEKVARAVTKAAVDTGMARATSPLLSRGRAMSSRAWNGEAFDVVA
jgi:malate dehydrogenase (oxaloacetate-decarboxylating)